MFPWSNEANYVECIRKDFNFLSKNTTEKKYLLRHDSLYLFYIIIAMIIQFHLQLLFPLIINIKFKIKITAYVVSTLPSSGNCHLLKLLYWIFNLIKVDDVKN